MALSFMPQADVRGTICYVICGSHPSDMTQSQDFQAAIHAQQPGKVFIFDHNSNEARALLDFFALTSALMPVSLLVREDDSLAYEWSGSLPVADDVLYRLHQIGD